MKITVFTSNQSRHISLVKQLSKICDSVFVVMGCKTVFPGQVQDFFKKTEVMQQYFNNVIAAERKIFGDLGFLGSNVHTLAIKNTDLNLLERSVLHDALQSDVYIVFGATYIKGWLIDFLVEHKALNIHMGVSPYYRGSSCNFWALYDNRPDLVGATIHYLSKGLDSGPMLYHALPQLGDLNPFEYTMQAVVAAHQSLVDRIADGTIFDLKPVTQDKTRELRYTRGADFTDEVARDFLSRELKTEDLRKLFLGKNPPDLLLPFYYSDPGVL